MKQVKRKKAFIGAIINAVGSIAGGIGQAISAKKQAKAEEEQFQKEQREQYKQDIISSANALQEQFANQDYAKQIRNSQSLRNGGKVIMNKYRDRFYNKKKTKRCGGRAKKEDGGSWQSTVDDVASGIASGASGFGSLISAIATKPQEEKTIQNLSTPMNTGVKTLSTPTTGVQQNNNVNGINNAMRPAVRYGKKKRIRK